MGLIEMHKRLCQQAFTVKRECLEHNLWLNYSKLFIATNLRLIISIEDINYKAPFRLQQMLSSLSLHSQTPLDKQQSRKVHIILKALLQHNQAYDFKQPVDWKGMNLSDYPTIVKSPMDLSTVQRNLKNGKYKIVQQFLDHVQLIWDNCKLYNMAGSWIYEVAEKIERNYKKMIKNYFPDIPITIPLRPIQSSKPVQKNTLEQFPIYGEQDITYFQKLKFCERVEKLDEQQLQRLIKWIKENYPHVLKDVGQERLQIVVDDFSQQAFGKVSELIYVIADGQIDRVSKRVKLT